MPADYLPFKLGTTVTQSKGLSYFNPAFQDLNKILFYSFKVSQSVVLVNRRETETNWTNNQAQTKDQLSYFHVVTKINC